MKKSLITGVTGQDGFYLSKLLLSKGHKVFGIKRRNSLINATARIDKLLTNKNFVIIQGDMSDPFFLNNLIVSKLLYADIPPQIINKIFLFVKSFIG